MCFISRRTRFEFWGAQCREIDIGYYRIKSSQPLVISSTPFQSQYAYNNGQSTVPSNIEQKQVTPKRKKKSKSYNSPINPSPGVSVSGSPISAFTPHTIVVSPILTSAEPWAVDIEPVLILTCLHTSSAAEAEAVG